MPKMNSLIRNDKKEVLLVFSAVDVNVGFPRYVGYNLTTSRVDEFQPSSPILSIGLEDLSLAEQKQLMFVLPALHAISSKTLAITAKARSGKDHLANRVKNRSPRSSIIKALAEPIYEIDYAINGRVKGKNRESLIMIGQGLRSQDPNIWIKVWLRRCIEHYVNTGGSIDKFICQDLRQPNEYSFFKNLGATIVGIKIDEDKRLAKIAELDGNSDLDAKLLKDETERNAGTYDVDYVLVNNYNENFDTTIDTFIGEILVGLKGW